MAAISSLQISFIAILLAFLITLFIFLQTFSVFFDNIISLCIAVREKVESI